ncbi:MAG: type II toxin-antitoxin system VapB family antitoxin [Terrimicrobiaceae bacterium]
MKTTLILDDRLMAEAMRQTGVTAKTAVVRLGLEALIQREAARRLASLGGAMPGLKVGPRRRRTRESA